MLDLHHDSIEITGKGVDASSTTAAMQMCLMAAAIQVREARAIGGGGCRCEGKEAKYGTLGANPVVL